MALLAFDSISSAPSAITDLLSPAQRMKTAGEVNAAILESFSQSKEVKLVQLLKLLCWGENMLSERADFPKVRTDGYGVCYFLRKDRLMCMEGCHKSGRRTKAATRERCTSDHGFVQ